ncbi:MAG: DUF2804 domain-containing protein [Clostridiales bacterium]|nr:DUF2804 domain-containing protein [Clostridiales bacterium]
MQQQIEFKSETTLLNSDGTLAINGGWARKNLFTFNRDLARPRWRLKEWDFYQLSNGRYMVQICFFNISIASAASATLLDLMTGELINSTKIVPFTIKKFPMNPKGDTPNYFEFKKGGTEVIFDTKENARKISFRGKSKGKPFILDFEMDILKDHENITIVTPFKGKPTRFFMTTKQNCMPCSGTVKHGDRVWTFDKSDTFAVLDWGRGVWPYRNEWYWGNGATYIDGKIFGFELTWKIGNEEFATETCLFYDGKAHKIGVVKLDKEPYLDGSYMKPWHFTSDDGRLDLTMTPFYDHHSGAVFIIGMETHQVHGLWNGHVILDDGKKLEIKDMYAFCEYVVNAW